MSHKRIFTASKLRQELMRPDSGRGDVDASLMDNNADASTEPATRVKPLRKNDFRVLSEHRISYVSRVKLFSEASRISEGTGDLRVLIAHAQLVDHLQTRHALRMKTGRYCPHKPMPTFSAARCSNSMPFGSEGDLISEEHREPSGYERAESYEGGDPEEADYDSDGSGEDEYDSDESGEDKSENDRGQKEVAGWEVGPIVAGAKTFSHGTVVTERELENDNDDQNTDDTISHPVTSGNDTDNDFVAMDTKDSRARRISS